MTKLQAEIEGIAARFADSIVQTIRGLTIEDLTGLFAASRAAPPTSAGASRASKRTGKAAASPKQAAARKLQGSYIGLLRKFPPKEKLVFKGIAREKSVAAAVAAMKKRLGRS